MREMRDNTCILFLKFLDKPLVILYIYMYNIYREKILKGFISIQYDGKKIVEEFSRHLAREILSLGTRAIIRNSPVTPWSLAKRSGRTAMTTS